MSTRKALSLCVALVVALVGSACRPNESLEGQTKDMRLKAAIKTKLASQVDASTLTAIEVNVTNGVVTLAGPMHSAEESGRIESVARGVEGVADVKNALQILATEKNVTALPVPPAAATPTGPTPAAATPLSK